MQDLTFGVDGPVMEGTWYNVKTGDSFTVRNSFFEDNQYIVQTTDGRVLNYNQIQNYIKSDKPIDIHQLNQQDIIPAEVSSLIEPEPNSLGNLMDSGMYDYRHDSQTATQPVTLTNHNTVDLTNHTVISKAMSKRTMPTINVDVKWKNFPIKEINMLIDLMDVTEEDIVDWYINNVDVDTVATQIKESIKKYLTDQLHPILNKPQDKPSKKNKKR